MAKTLRELQDEVRAMIQADDLGLFKPSYTFRCPDPPPMPQGDDDFGYTFRARNYPFSIGMDMPSMVGRIKIPDEPEPLPVCSCGQTIWSAEDVCSDCQQEGNHHVYLDAEGKVGLGLPLDERIRAAKARDVDPTSDWSAWSHPSWES
jgi:hypothetical protein